MKKTILITVLTLAFASCKKDYVCTCTATVNMYGQTSSASQSTTIHTTKNQAEATCNGYKSTSSYVTTTCHLN